MSPGGFSDASFTSTAVNSPGETDLCGARLGQGMKICARCNTRGLCIVYTAAATGVDARILAIRSHAMFGCSFSDQSLCCCVCMASQH
jgi:hypothetical protein